MSRILTTETREKRPTFWKRQFALERTETQDCFDVVFGAILPVICFLFDPIVFKGSTPFGGEPLAGKYQFFTYLLSAIEIAALLIWLKFGRPLKSFSGPISGVLIGGGLFSFLIGVLILPFSLMGLVILIGAAGFTPFLTSFVYLRNGIRGLRSHEKNSAHAARFQVATASAVIALALPVFVSIQLSQKISTSINTVLNGDGAQAEMAVNNLKRLPFVSESDVRPLVNAYSRELDPVRKNKLAKAYRDLSGRDIERTIAIIND